MGTSTLVAGIAVKAGMALLESQKQSYGCEVVIHNETDHVLVGKDSKLVRGALDPSEGLPFVAPRVVVPSGDHEGKKASSPVVTLLYGSDVYSEAALLLWEVLGVEGGLYLYVFPYLGGRGQQNGGAFGLWTEWDENKLDNVWSNTDEKHEGYDKASGIGWYYAGDGLSTNCQDTKKGITVLGTLQNEAQSEFHVTLRSA